MMMTTIIREIILLFFLATGFYETMAQKFISKGSIIYERKIQIHKLLETNEWMKDRLDDIPKFYISNFELSFNVDSTFYAKSGDDEPNNGAWGVYARENEISTLFLLNQCTAKKAIYLDEFTIRDSIKTYSWKLINETRNIAGIECKKATTIINDSVFVVAFYAENIIVSGGPEQFGGLPGMILGVVIPRLHVSYYAKKIEVNEKQKIKFPKQKAKAMTRKEFQEMVFKNMKWAFSNGGIGVLYLFL